MGDRYEASDLGSVLGDHGCRPRSPAVHYTSWYGGDLRPKASGWRVDTYAAALFHDMTVEGFSELDLSYTPPLGSPWDATQMATQTWARHLRATALS